jgi:antirestriction protein ArdC
MSERSDIYERVTGHIIEAIERGAESRRMPWHLAGEESFLPINAASGKCYRGVNVLYLWAVADLKGYASPMWATYKQWHELGARVRQGEKSSLIVYWSIPERSAKGEEDDEGRSGRGFFARGYSVFNVAQVDGFTPPPVPELPPASRIDAAEEFFGSIGADIRHGGTEAFYEHATDVIQLPRFEVFREPIAYYSTLAHEVTHWTGAKARLDRDLSGRFGSNAYAAEELVAELGAAFVCASLRLTSEPRPDHAAYTASWLRLLRSDKRAIFTAASKAQQAADFMHERQPVQLAA